jgi:nitrilase
MGTRGTLTVAAVQMEPVLLDRAGCLERAVAAVGDAADRGAKLVLLPESAVPGYPDFVWRTTPWSDVDWYPRFHDAAVDPASDLDDVREAAATAGAWVALGITERSTTGTLYNSVAHIDQHGELAAVHRKLIPTGAERLVWGNGQADDRGSLLTVVEHRGVRIGTLICWENYMPLARAALYAEGIDLLLSPTFDNSDVWVPTMRHIAKEGRVFVMGCTPFMTGACVPDDVAGADSLYHGPDDPISVGNTCIVAPGGELLAGPLTGGAGMVVATLDLDRIGAARRQFDPAGHYARPEVLRLDVRRGGG